MMKLGIFGAIARLNYNYGVGYPHLMYLDADDPQTVVVSFRKQYGASVRRFTIERAPRQPGWWRVKGCNHQITVQAPTEEDSIEEYLLRMLQTHDVLTLVAFH